MLRCFHPRALAIAFFAALCAGCLSGAYDKDFEARFQQYKREAAGEPPAAAAGGGGEQPPAAAGG
jgi:hypothetical protein